MYPPKQHALRAARPHPAPAARARAVRVVLLVVVAACGSAKPRLDAGQAVDASPTSELDAGVRPRDAAPPQTGLPDVGSAALPDGSAETPGVGDAGSSMRDLRDASVRDAGSAAAARSAGCGKAATGTSSYQMRTIRVGERDRVYFLRVPSSYDRNRAYPLFFGFHNSGGNGTSGGVDLAEFADEGAIFVSPTAIEPNRTFPEQLPAELSLFDALRERMSNDFCIDRDNLYAVGMSAGAEMTNFLSCKRGDLLRATGALSGRISPGNADDLLDNCLPTPATFLYHAADDDVADVAASRTLVKARVKALGCESEEAFDKAGDCRSYRGCLEPLTYCEPAAGGHGGGITRVYRERMWKFLTGR